MKKKQLISSIFCSDNRSQSWVKLLLSSDFNEIYLSESDIEWSVYSAQNSEGVIISEAELPKAVDVVFVHTGSGDLERFIRSGLKANFVFKFNSPGSFSANESGLLIYQETLPNFRITQKQINETVDFINRQRSALPSMCCSDKGWLGLLALSILCQGYLIVHINLENNETETLESKVVNYRFVDKVLREMGLTELIKQRPGSKFTQYLKSNQIKLQHKVSDSQYWQIINDIDFLKEEWSESQAEFVSNLEPLLIQLKQKEKLSPSLVAEVYQIIAEKIGHPPELSLDKNYPIVDLPFSILVLGNNLISNTLIQFFELFEIECYQHASIPENASIESDFKYDLLEKPSLCITFAGSNAEAIFQAKRLRTEFHWFGNFLVIAKDMSDRKSLENTDIFGDFQGKFTYEKLPGHIVLSQPLLLRDILLTTGATEDLFPEGWLEWHDKSKLGLLLKDIPSIQQLLSNGYTSEAIAKVLHIINSIRQISWGNQIPHSQLPTVRKLLQYNDLVIINFSNEECMQFTLDIEQLLLTGLGNF